MIFIINNNRFYRLVVAALTESQCAGIALRSPHREVQITKERDINVYCIKSVRQFEPFLLTVLNVSCFACEEPFIEKCLHELYLNIHLYLTLNYVTASEHLKYSARKLYAF